MPLARFRRALLVAGTAVVCASVAGCGSSTRRDLAVDSVSVSPDGSTLTAVWSGGGCDIPDSVRASAKESASTVTLRLDVDSPGGTCFDIGVRGREQIVLASPLDGRAIIDATDGHRLEPGPLRPLP